MMGFLILFFACSSADPKSDTAASQDITATSACLMQDADQIGLWNRLDTPSSITLTNQVAPSLLVYQDELWLYYSQRDGLKDSIFLIRSQDGETWSSPESISDLDSFSDIMTTACFG